MLAIIAGNGGLPGVLIDAAKARPYVAALEGFEPAGVEPDEIFRIEHLGSLMARLLEKGITQVCFAGGIRRPKVDPSKIDEKTMPLVPRIAAAIGAGDDGALRAIIELFEEVGLGVVAAHEIAPELLLSPGCPTKAQPDKEDTGDVARAEAVLATMGSLDLGQACVVRRGQVLAVEASPGTNWMLESLKNFGADGALFYKAPKPGQDLRVDLPTIGPETIRVGAEIGIKGLVIEAGGVMVLDPDATIAAADDAGLYLWIRSK